MASEFQEGSGVVAEAPIVWVEPAHGCKGLSPKEQLTKHLDFLGLGEDGTELVLDLAPTGGGGHWMRLAKVQRDLEAPDPGVFLDVYDVLMTKTKRENNEEPSGKRHGNHNWLFEAASVGVKEYRNKTFQVYFKPNQFAGKGHTAEAENVVATRAFVGESDGGTFLEQWALAMALEALGLRFNALLDSGGKSLHHFIRAPKGMPVDWERDERINKKLCVAINGDPRVINRDRSMRLAGFERQGGRRQALLKGTSDELYTSVEDLEATLDRVLLELGVTDWEATFKELDGAGEGEDTLRSLLRTSEWDPTESWRSGPSTPCRCCGRTKSNLCEEWVFVEEDGSVRKGITCYVGDTHKPPTTWEAPWGGKQMPLEQGDLIFLLDGTPAHFCGTRRNRMGAYKVFVIDQSPLPRVTEEQFWREPAGTLAQTGSAQEGVPVRDALDAQDRAELQLRFSELRASMEVSLDLRDVLPLRLANVLTEAADAMPVDPVALLAPLLCAIAATAGTRVEVFVKAGWQEPLVLWMANVMRPGAMKSPIASIVSQPMHRLEAEWRRDWEHLVREGGEFVAADPNDPGQPPAVEPVRRIVVGDCSYERAVELMGQKNIPGFLSLQDELGGFFAQFQKNPVARSGWLSLWSGGPAALDRKTVKSAYAPKTATSLFGNMQPDKLTSLLAEEKGQQSEGGDGLWSRFLWCRPKETVFRWNRDGIDVTRSLQELLESVDQQLQGFRLRLRVDQEVMDEFVGPLFEQWAQDGIRTNSARAAFLSKLRGYTIRFMGVLSLLELAERNTSGWRNWLNTPPEVEEFQLDYEIRPETMARAVALARFYLAQWDALQPEVAPSENDGPPKWVAKFLRKVKDGDQAKVTPRDLVSWRLDRRISTSSAALTALKELEEKWGHGVVKQGARKDQFWWEPSTAELLNAEGGNC